MFGHSQYHIVQEFKRQGIKPAFVFDEGGAILNASLIISLSGKSLKYIGWDFFTDFWKALAISPKICYDIFGKVCALIL